MMRIVIFGNSGSGKSTLAKCYARIPGVAHLDLDTIAWKTGQPGVREEARASIEKLKEFTVTNDEWVIEGCYAVLISEVAKLASELIFLNPGTEVCQQNCRARPWESHKYKSKDDQDKNLEMLLGWVADYETRSDEFSLLEHQKLYAAFSGKKQELMTNKEAQNKMSEVTALSRNSS